ncbi:hypothetical protein Dimus_008429 [Dionaea muscipula]
MALFPCSMQTTCLCLTQTVPPFIVINGGAAIQHRHVGRPSMYPTLSVEGMFLILGTTYQSLL